MPESQDASPVISKEEEATRTNDYLQDQMSYLKSRFAHERRKLEERSFARKRDA
jgi:hypothetical protein